MVRFMKIQNTLVHSVVWWLCLLLIAFSIVASGCGERESRKQQLERERLMAIGQLPADHKPGDLVPVRVGLINYTDEEIDEVYVDGSWAANVAKHSSTTGIGSARTPAFYDPHYIVTVRWRNESLFLKDETGIFTNSLVPEPPQKDELGYIGELWVAFFPDGSVKLYPTVVRPGAPGFPDDLQDPKDECLKARPEDAASCYGNGAPDFSAEGE